MLPTESDIQKQKKKLSDLLKLIGPTGQSDEKKMVTMVRGAIRQSWMRSPTKLAYLHSHIEPDMDEETRTKWKVKCECCEQYQKMADVEVDHIKGCNTFTKIEDFDSYFNSILMVDFSGLQILCKECHAIKTLSERNGVDFETAKAHKQAIAIEKSKQDKSWLTERGIEPAGSKEKRREQIIKKLLTT